MCRSSSRSRCTSKPRSSLEHRRREPAPGIFRLVLPLPFPDLNRVNAYLLTDADGCTLVDCGIFDPSEDFEHGWEHLVGALEACEKRPEDIGRVVVTHTHVDHYGMAGWSVERAGAELWMHSLGEPELDLYRDPDGVRERLCSMLVDHGVPQRDVDELVGYEDWRPYVSRVVSADRSLEDGDSFVCGGRTWEVVHTPGHARSHICLWDARDRILISGDHLLPTITPHIDFERGGAEDPLGAFIESLAKIEHLDPALVLPGHGRPFEDGAERARIIERHHDRRLGMILQTIRHVPHSANEITEEVFGATLLDFHRRLALSEALAHLVYLRRRDEVERIQQPDGTFAYKKTKRTRPPEDLE